MQKFFLFFVGFFYVQSSLIAEEYIFLSSFNSKYSIYSSCSSLFWKTKLDKTRAGTFIDDFSNSSLETVKGSLIEPNFKLNSGFRVNIGFASLEELWNVKIVCTLVPLNANKVSRKILPLDQQTDEHRQFIVPNVNDFPFFQVFAPNGGGEVGFSSLSTKWNGDFSCLDMDLSYKVNCSSRFSLNPHIGFRSSWIQQYLFMKGKLLQPSARDSLFGNLNFNQKFHGYGIEGGVSGNWDLGCGFGIMGHVGGSILYGNFTLNMVSKSRLEKNKDSVFTTSFKGGEISAVPTMDCFIGLTHSRTIEDISFSYYIGFEQKVFFNMNQMSTSGGNLSLQGLTFGEFINY